MSRVFDLLETCYLTRTSHSSNNLPDLICSFIHSTNIHKKIGLSSLILNQRLPIDEPNMTQFFFQFEISCQHLKIRSFHIKVQISGFPWIIRSVNTVSAAFPHGAKLSDCCPCLGSTGQFSIITTTLCLSQAHFALPYTSPLCVIGALSECLLCSRHWARRRGSFWLLIWPPM